MKAALNLDQDADLSQVSDAYRLKLKFEMRQGKMVPFYPKGTEFEGEHALRLVSTGQASPSDPECAAAVGMSSDQVQAKQREYLAASRGIKGKKDLAMFMAGAIEGYAPDSTDANPVYIPGPNWGVWQAAESAKVDDIKKDVI